MIDINKKKTDQRKICKLSTCTVVYTLTLEWLTLNVIYICKEIMLIKHAIKSLFLYFNLCLNVEMVILLCSFISIMAYPFLQIT